MTSKPCAPCSWRRGPRWPQPRRRPWRVVEEEEDEEEEESEGVREALVEMVHELGEVRNSEFGVRNIGDGTHHPRTT